MKARFGVNHPEYKKAAAAIAELQKQIGQSRQNIAQRVAVEYREAVNRQEMLNKAINQTKAEADQLNARSFEYQALKNEADADKKFYDELIEKIRESTINAGFQSSAIRLADLARQPARPVSPNIPLNVALSLLLSTLLGLAGAVAFDLMDHTMRDPQLVLHRLNTEVIGLLPFEKPVKLWGALRQNNGNGGSALTASVDIAQSGLSGQYGDAIRTLRNSILLSSQDRPLGSLLVTSSLPGEGKTTTAVHLAMAHAEQGYKTLLIDCDLRRPTVHKYFSASSENGMSAVCARSASWESVTISIRDRPNLDVILAGPTSRRTAYITVGQTLARVLEEASHEYDLIVVDAPPVLGFPRAAPDCHGRRRHTSHGSCRRKPVSRHAVYAHRVEARAFQRHRHRHEQDEAWAEQRLLLLRRVFQVQQVLPHRRLRRSLAPSVGARFSVQR